MTQIVLRPGFNKDLAALRSNHRVNYSKVSEVMQELQRGEKPSLHRRSETRLPNAVKFELSDGYRAVFQEVEGADILLGLVVGKHDYVDSFLDGHKGFVFDHKTHRLKELRLATVEDTTVVVVPSQALDRDSPDGSAEPVTPHPAKAFADFSDPMLLALGVPAEEIAAIAEVVDPDSLAVLEALGRIEQSSPEAAHLLLAYTTGNTDTRDMVLRVARGEADYRVKLASTDIASVNASTEEFLTFEDPQDLEGILERGTFAQWQLFLHPDQKALVERRFAGPARIRGISGSGKTVVALHRARRVAKQLVGTNRFVLFTTFDKGLANEAARLLDLLCGEERKHIEVTHLHRWCLDYLRFAGLPPLRFSPEVSSELRRSTRAALPVTERQALEKIPDEYLWGEVEFLMGRFLHEDAHTYLETDRSGRGTPLNAVQRKGVLALYTAYLRALFERGCVEPAEWVRIALRERLNGTPTERNYSAVIVDEVQDMSEIGLRLLHSISGEQEDGFLMVGDNAQRIFTRGFSLRGIGVDVTGRSIVLRKNYRNTRQILTAAFPLVSAEWESDERSAGAASTDLRPEFSVREGHRPLIVRCTDEEHEAAFLAAEVSALLKYQHYNPRDICVVGRTRRYRELATAALTRAALPWYTYQRSANGEVTSDEDKIRVSTMHAVKGHEYGAVFIVGTVEGVIPHPHPGDPEGDAGERALLYVAMTRARDIVYLSYSARRTTGAILTRSPLLGEIARHCDSSVYKPHASHPIVPTGALTSR